MKRWGHLGTDAYSIWAQRIIHEAVQKKLISNALLSRKQITHNTCEMIANIIQTACKRETQIHTIPAKHEINLTATDKDALFPDNLLI